MTDLSPASLMKDDRATSGDLSELWKVTRIRVQNVLLLGGVLSPIFETEMAYGCLCVNSNFSGFSTPPGLWLPMRINEHHLWVVEPEGLLILKCKCVAAPCI